MVGVLAADDIRCTGPDNAAHHIEHRNHQHVGRSKGAIHHSRQRGSEDFIHHGLGHADDPDTGSDIETEDDP